MQPCTDLVVRVQRDGDRAALEEIFRTVGPDVYRLLLSELRNDADAQDASQETFRQAIESLPALRDPRAFPAWLIRIALDKARAVRRARSAGGSEAAERARHSGDGPMETMEKRELRAQVRRAVEGLDADLQTAVRLRYDHGMSYAQIAEATAEPEGTVAWRLSEAHRRLQKTLAGAGVALALAALESELSAGEPVAMPERLAGTARRMAREAPLAAGRWTPPAQHGGRKGTAAIAAGLLCAVAVFVAVKSRGQEAPAESGTAAAAEDARAPKSGESASADPRGGETASRTTSPAKAAAAVISGIVRDRDSGRPVAGATVRLSRGEEQARTTTTGAAGEFRIEAPTGEYVLNAWADGFVSLVMERKFAGMSADPLAKTQTETDTRVSLRDGETCVRDIELTAGLDVRGRVVDERALGVAGATIRIQHRVGSWGFFDAYEDSGAVRTDLEGRFTIRGVRSGGRLELTAEKDGYGPGEGSVEVVPNAPETVLAVRSRPPGRFAGLVRDASGRPLKDAHFFVQRQDHGSQLTQLERRSDGEGGIDGTYEGLDRLAVAWKPGYGPALIDVFAAGLNGFETTLPYANQRLRIRVSDGHGRPFEGLSVWIVQVGIKTDAGTAWLLYKTPAGMPQLGAGFEQGELWSFFPGMPEAPLSVTDASGTFTFDGLCLDPGVKLVLGYHHADATGSTIWTPGQPDGWILERKSE